MTIYTLFANPQYSNKNILSKIIKHICQIESDNIVLHYEDDISSEQIQHILDMYHQYIVDRKPLEYIFGYVEFLGNRFVLDERSLIPRAETEYMIQGVCEYIDELSCSDIAVMDIGCGSGVLGLSVALHRSAYVSDIYLSDSEDNCISLTRENITQYSPSLPDIDTHLVQDNLMERVSTDIISYINKKKYLLIVSNLPYIPDETFDTQVDISAQTREPRVAFVGGSDGMNLYRDMLGYYDQHIHSQLDIGSAMFLEMMTRQMDILIRDMGDIYDFQIIKTFHFNIIIVRCIHK